MAAHLIIFYPAYRQAGAFLLRSGKKKEKGFSRGDIFRQRRTGSSFHSSIYGNLLLVISIPTAGIQKSFVGL
jgi:hypothetical protein